MFYYGSHLSTKNNLLDLIDYIKSINGNMIQIFISNPISINSNINPYFIKNSSKIKQKLLDNNVKLVIHLPYVINIANEFDINNAQIKLIIDQLSISNLIGSIGCILHVGKSKFFDINLSIDNMFKNLKYIILFLKKNNMDTHIILETAAGQGTELISDIFDFFDFYKKFSDDEKKYLRLCIDSCHIYAAGYNISDKLEINKLFKFLKNQNLMKYIDLIHLNDSKKDCGCKVDRHENIGFGKIGIQGLYKFIKKAIYYNIPIILETPSNYIEEIKFIEYIFNKKIK